MSESTSKLGLYKPGGGSTGTITPTEQVDIDKINGNMDKIDAAIGAVTVTSTTHPATPYDGLTIWESDTYNTLIYSGANTRYVPVGVPNVRSDAERDAFYPSPVQGTVVNRVDKGYPEQYFAVYNATSNPNGSKTAGWWPHGIREVDTSVVGTLSSGYTIDTEGVVTGSQASAYTNGILVWLRIRVAKTSGTFSHAVPFFTITDTKWLPKGPSRFSLSGTQSGGAGSASIVGLQLQQVGGTGSDKDNWQIVPISPAAQNNIEFSIQYQRAISA